MNWDKSIKNIQNMCPNTSILSRGEPDQVDSAGIFPYLHIHQSKCEPAHEIMARFVLRKFILQTHIRSYPVELVV